MRYLEPDPPPAMTTARGGTPQSQEKESGKELIDPVEFEKSLGMLADRMTQEIAYGEELWIKLICSAFDFALPKALPASQRRHLRRVLDAELKGGGTVRIEKDSLHVSGRTRKPEMLTVCWSGPKMRGSGTLTLWVVPRPARIGFSGGKWQDAGKRGRFATITSAAALIDALEGAEIL